MKTLFSLLRLLTIIRILLRHGLDELLWIIPWLRPLRYLSRLLPRSRRHRGGQGKRLRLALEDLGPVFIKFGQALSTRRDLLTPELADEFRYLQDQVPPFPGEIARQIIEKSCGQSISDLFKEFETKPMASASVAQVHAARLHDGTAVVVKVLRPNIDKTIRQDIRLMYIIAGLLQRYWKEGKRLRPVDIVYEYEKNILDELDMQREAANASQLRRNFEGSDDLYIPEVYWDYSTEHVMVMERIYGIPIGDIEALKKQHINFQRLAERGVEIFFTQVFKHNFFHADMHPGNIFVESHKPDDPRYLAVDFGIIGTLSADDQRYLAENFHAFFNRDYRRVAELHVESGWVPAHTRIEEFESAIRAVCEPIFERPISEISFGHLLLRLFQTARRFEMEVQPQLVLFQKTLLNIEGLGRQLYPELNLWVTAKPFIERWIDEQVGFRALLRGAQYNIPKLLENLPYMPNLVFDILKQTQQNRLKLQWESQQLSQLQKTTAHQYYRIRLILTGGIMVIAASLNIGQSLSFLLNPLIWNGLFMSIGGLLLLVGLIK